MAPPYVIALKGNKQWVVSGRAVSGIYLLNSEGVVQYRSALPWLPARDESGRKIDVVGLCNLKSPLSVNSLSSFPAVEPLRPILLRGEPDDVDDERQELYSNHYLYLPLHQDQLCYRGRRTLEGTSIHEWIVTLGAIAELSGVDNPVRFEVQQFTVTQTANL